MVDTKKHSKLTLKACVVVLFLGLSIICFRPEHKSSVEPAGVNSSELVLNVSEENGVRREEYVDSDGKITLAADKHYASVVKRLNENGRVVSEYYFDENDKPVSLSDGQYGVLREYDEQGHEVKVTYVDAEGNPMRISSGYVSVLKTYDDKGNEIKDEYVNAEGNPAYRSEGYAAREKEYDENGRVNRVMYYISDSSPAKSTLGQYGEAYEYDELGRRYKITYLDENGDPMLNREGYATVVKTFKTDNSTDTEMYFDTAGQPIKLSHGQYGIRRYNGNTIYLTKNGKMNILLSLDELLHDHVWAALIIGLIVCLLSVFLPIPVNGILIIGYALFIIYMTLMYRKGGNPTARLEVLWSYKRFFRDRSLRVETFQNIWLFIPFGTLLHSISKKNRMLFIPLAFSVFIEITQYVTGRGLFEFDDIISNTLGGCIGFWIGELLEWLLTRRKQNSETVVY